MTEAVFFESIDGWISAPKSSWNHITLLAYFCFKYESVTGVKFRLVRGRKGPTLGKEARDFSKLFLLFAPEDYKKLSPKDKLVIKTNVNKKIFNYINWVFDYKLRRRDKSVTGTKFFHIPSVINEFEQMYSSYLAKNTSKDKMSSLISWAKEFIPNIFELHQVCSAKDLRMIEKYVKMYSLDSSTEEVRLINKALELKII